MLYGAVYCAARNMEDKMSMSSSNLRCPSILPASIMMSTVNETQQEWWATAYKFYTNTAK